MAQRPLDGHDVAACGDQARELSTTRAGRSSDSSGDVVAGPDGLSPRQHNLMVVNDAPSKGEPSENDSERALGRESARELTPAEKQMLRVSSAALRKLISNTYMPEFDRLQKQIASIAKINVPVIPPSVLESFGRVVMPQLPATKLFDSGAFKLASTDLLKGFDFGGVTAAAELVAKANFGWNQQLHDIAAKIAKQQSAWLKNLGKFDFKFIVYPANIEDIEDLRLAELEQVILVEGIPLYGLPRQAIAKAIIRAKSPEKRREILGRRWKDIAVDCRQHVEGCRSYSVRSHTQFALRAIDAIEAGHHESAQALAANLLDTILRTHLAEDRVVLVPSKKVKTPEGYNELALREWLALAPIWAAHQSYFPSNGEPIPRTFNRHATAHGVSTRQFSKRNAIQVLMLVCSLLRYIDARYDRTEQVGSTSLPK